MIVRIRKRDMSALDNNEFQDTEMYCRCAEGETLAIRIRDLVCVDLKDKISMDFTVTAIHVLRSQNAKTGMRSCILTGHVNNFVLSLG